MARRTSYRRLAPYFRRYAWVLVAGMVAVIASRALMVLAPRYLGGAINLLRSGDESLFGQAVRRGWTFLALTVGSGCLTYVMRYLLVGTSRRVERNLKRDLFAHVEHLPASAFDRLRTGDLLSRLTSDIEAVRFSFGPGIMYVVSTLVLVPLALASMVQLDGALTLLTLLPLVAIGIVVRVLAPSIMRRTRAVQDRIGDLSARAQESFAGARVVRAYATEAIEKDAFRRENEGLVAETLALARTRAWMTGLLYLLGGLGNLAVLWAGGRRVIDGSLGYGDLVTFLAYVAMLIWPMISVGWVVSSFQRSAAAMQRLEDLLGRDVEPSTLDEPIPAPARIAGALAARHLTFTYEGATRPALTDVSFELPAGGTLGLVGPVGSGKSTLLALLTRQRTPPPGTVFLDGRDVRRLPLATLREAFAVVPQDAFLFSTTLRENLALATGGEIDTGRAQEALRMAGLAEDVAGFPDGLETLVGERGLTLSGGQKQRMTLARALLREAPVLLLDDTLSAVDTETEARILEHLLVEMRRRTTVVVAHRLGTVRHADHILVLDDGRVVESGTHDQLVAAGGWYARTHERQRLEARVEGAS
ncbi:MAG: ABC transporter ATP-binding protein [Planctomycetota bacterium]